MNFCCHYIGCSYYEELTNDCSFMYISEGITYPNGIYQLSVSYGSVYHITIFSLFKRHEKLLQNLLNGALVQAVFGNEAAVFGKCGILSDYLPYFLTSNYKTPGNRHLSHSQRYRSQHCGSSWAKKEVCSDLT